MRKLASIQRVLAVRPINGADKIEVADVLGWSVVVGKGEFQVGDLAVYFEIDSWLDSSNPAFASFEERFTNWDGKRGMRLKTIRLRKQISQGLLMPVSKFKEFGESGEAIACKLVVTEGQDVTELLKIEKWEAVEEVKSNGGSNKVAGAGKFPSFIRKTDQERVQNYVGELPKYDKSTFEVSIKLDGSSMTVYYVPKSSKVFEHAMEDVDIRAVKKMNFLQKWWYGFKVKHGWLKRPDALAGVCSRNIELELEDNNHFSRYVADECLIERLAEFCEASKCALAIQGELIGPVIQNNYEKVEQNKFYVYDVFDIDKQEYLKPVEARTVVDKLMINYVPIVNLYAELKTFGLGDKQPREVVDALLQFAEGEGMNNGVKREGLVFKCNENEFSFKAISTSYLLAKG